MEKRKTWRGELTDNGLLYGVAAVMVSAFYSLARLTRLLGAPLLAGILIISGLNFIDHPA